MGERARGQYEDIIRAIFSSKLDSAAVSSITVCPVQGFSSKTYFVSLADHTSIVVQVRPESRALPLTNLDEARAIFGQLVPTAFLLGKEMVDGSHIRLYGMSRLPGHPLSSLIRDPQFVSDTLPAIAASLGHIFGSAIIPGSTAEARVLSISHDLQLAVNAETDSEPFLTAQSIYSSILATLRRGCLDSIPLTLSNGDVSPTNILISNTAVSGIVDWEYTEQSPLGFDCVAIFWLMGWGTDTTYVLHPNAAVIEKAFWKSFTSAIPPSLRDHKDAVELGLHVGAAMRTTWDGAYQMPLFSSLEMMTTYRIPLDCWVGFPGFSEHSQICD